jgi:RNA polymerase sigma-70 factor (ECF subfamily)
MVAPSPARVSLIRVGIQGSAGRLPHCSGCSAFDRRKTVARVLRDSLGVTKRSLADLSDVELLGAVADGDQSALRVLYERHASWISLRLRHRCADVDVAAEALQETFVAVWRKPGSHSGSGEVAAWLWGIAIRRLIGVLRKTSRPIVPYGDSDEVMVSAEEQVLAGVEHGDLAGALAGMSPELRAVVQATVLDGLTNREAARLLDIPVGTVKTRMARARVELREALA